MEIQIYWRLQDIRKREQLMASLIWHIKRQKEKTSKTEVIVLVSSISLCLREGQRMNAYFSQRIQVWFPASTLLGSQLSETQTIGNTKISLTFRNTCPLTQIKVNKYNTSLKVSYVDLFSLTYGRKIWQEYMQKSLYSVFTFLVV